MRHRWPGLLLLIALALGLIYSRTVLAAAPTVTPTTAPRAVNVQVSPLVLMTQGQVTVRVDGEPCRLVAGAQPTTVCPDLPPGDYAVTASATGYVVVPAEHALHISSDGTSDLAVQFNFYRARHQLFMPMIEP